MQNPRHEQRAQHWERIYSGRDAREASWYQARAALSLRLIGNSGIGKDAAVIDVGGGASTLVDDLLREGYTNVTVLDVSASALAAARQRLGDAAGRVKWIEADITLVELPEQSFDLWHDRAVFHFLTAARDRSAYVGAMLRSVRLGGSVIVATFAESGPQQCSGLPVVRYRPETLAAALGDAFTLLEHCAEDHRTPAGAIQPFVYCRFRRRLH